MKLGISGTLTLQEILEGAPRIIFNISLSNRIVIKDAHMLVLPVDQKVLASIQPIDSAGNPAKIEGQPSWTSSSETILSVAPNPDDGSGTYSAWVTPVGALGSAQVNVSADADLGAGVTTITGVLDIQTTAGTAVGFTISTAPAVPKT